MGLTQVAELTGLLKSDAHRILKSLQQFGFIEQDGERGRYRLGLELLELGHLVHERLRWSDTARPILRRLSETADGVANLAVYDPVAKKIVFIEQIGLLTEGQASWRIGERVGFPHATAVGKTLLAHLDPETVLALIGKNGLKPKTRHTIINTAELQRELERVREQGFATDREEAMEGASCVAAPVRDYTRRVVAAVSISMTAEKLARTGERKVASMVISAADKISAVLGGRSRPLPIADNAARVRSRAPARKATESRQSKRRSPDVKAQAIGTRESTSTSLAST